MGNSAGTLFVTNFVARKTYFVPTSFCRCAIFGRLERAVAVRNSLLETFSGKFRRRWKILHRFSGSAKCYPCQGLGIFRQGQWLLENWPRLRERCWIFSSETATASLSSSDIWVVFGTLQVDPQTYVCSLHTQLRTHEAQQMSHLKRNLSRLEHLSMLWGKHVLILFALALFAKSMTGMPIYTLAAPTVAIAQKSNRSVQNRKFYCRKRRKIARQTQKMSQKNRCDFLGCGIQIVAFLHFQILGTLRSTLDSLETYF